MALGFPWIAGWLGAALRQPTDVFAAFGFGRSYGSTTCVLGREVSSLSDCGLWTALDHSAGAITAFVCDIGNDILYGAEPPVIESWVAGSVDRLLERGARVALMGLPLATITELSSRRFYLIRSIFYPLRSLPQRQVTERARDLDARLHALARSRRIELVTPRADWYGWDPIHFRANARAAAWTAVLGTLLPLDPGLLRRERRAAAWRLAPDRRRILGFLQRRMQPSLQLGELRVSLY